MKTNLKHSVTDSNFSERYELDNGKISFSRVLLEDIGMYQCVAENGFGLIYQTVSLHVRGMLSVSLP